MRNENGSPLVCVDDHPPPLIPSLYIMKIILKTAVDKTWYDRLEKERRVVYILVSMADGVGKSLKKMLEL